jgi:hypothetical protein
MSCLFSTHFTAPGTRLPDEPEFLQIRFAIVNISLGNGQSQAEGLVVER